MPVVFHMKTAFQFVLVFVPFAILVGFLIPESGNNFIKVFQIITDSPYLNSSINHQNM